MTIWDNIYRNYQDGGEAWATLSEGLHPLFKKFLSQSNFQAKRALDIGCGTGAYLKMLQNTGFETDGIDSSETAVEMTKKLLKDHSAILCADMFDFEIPKDTYDLVISTTTIHHGTKKQVQNLIDRIHEAIQKNGRIFISVPDLESNIKNGNLTDYQEIAKGTYVLLSGPEKGLPHSLYTREEAQKLFSKFSGVTLDLDDKGRWIAQASK